MRFQRFIFWMTLVIGVLFLIIVIVPGDWSPLGILQNFAALFTGDGNSGGLALSSYHKLQKLLLVAGVVLLLGAGLLVYAHRSGRFLFGRNVAIGIGVGYLLGILLFGNLAIERSHSLVYRQIFGPGPTLTPTSVPPTPIPTLEVFGTGHWEMVADGLSTPTAIVDPDDGSGRLFVLEETGAIRIIQSGKLLPEPFLDLKDRVFQGPDKIYEQGLLGLVFHPNFEENGYFYVFYTDNRENSVLSRFQVSNDAQKGNPNSEFRLLGIIKPGPSHNGGTLVFGPDGYLYVSLGDGVLRQKTKGHAQSLDEIFGKILRLDVDHGNPYAIPPDNPFVNAYGRDEIYLYGFRNPWKFSFDSVTGDLYIGDVGQNDWEEINFLAAGQPAGLNYGWDAREGPEPFGGYRGAPIKDATFTEAIFYYHHKPNKCAVVGGVVYHGTAFPNLEGTYLFGDYCSGYIWGLKSSIDGWEATLLYDTQMLLSSFGTDAAGEVYATDFRGMIYKLVP